MIVLFFFRKLCISFARFRFKITFSCFIAPYFSCNSHKFSVSLAFFFLFQTQNICCFTWKVFRSAFWKRGAYRAYLPMCHPFGPNCRPSDFPMCSAATRISVAAFVRPGDWFIPDFVLTMYKLYVILPRPIKLLLSIICQHLWEAATFKAHRSII